MAQPTFSEYNVTEVGKTDVYSVKATTKASGLVNGQDLGAGDQFRFNGNTFTYIGGADTVTTGSEAGFFATTGSGTSLKTHFFSNKTLTAPPSYILDKTERYLVPDVPCFARATLIATPDGETAVEDLNAGDLVTTMVDGDTVTRPVKWIGRRLVHLGSHPRPETVAPVRIQRGAFADALPQRDLLVSPDHAIFVDGRLICARQLVNGTTIRAENGLTVVEYFHIELESHAILLAEGLAAESYLDTGNKGFFANTGEPTVLHPDMTDEADYPTRERDSCAPFTSAEADVRPIWQRLADRAAAIGQPMPAIDVATDPDLHVVAGGKTLRPLYAGDGVYQFMLPPAATDVRVISRAAAPTELRPWLEDRRRLGVYAESIVLRSADNVTDVPVDHPALSLGWWKVERSATGLRRWTDGDAVLKLPVVDGPTVLEIRATSSGMEYPLRAAG